MIRTSLLLFASGILLFFLGMNQLAGISFEQGQLLLLVMTSLALVAFPGASLVASWVIVRNESPEPPLTDVTKREIQEWIEREKRAS